MKSTLLLLFLGLCSNTFSQSIEFLVKGDTLLQSKYQRFSYLSDSTDVSKAIFVAKIKATGSLKNVTYLYYFIKNKAQEKGANAFRLESFTKLNPSIGELILSTYYASDSLFEANDRYLPQHTIYIFGYEDLTDTKTQGYKINGVKHEIGCGEYSAYDMKEGEEYKINKGGFTGMTYWLKGKKEGDCSFLSFSGLGLNGADYNTMNNGIGVSINTGKINNVDPGLAFTLLTLYLERK